MKSLLLVFILTALAGLGAAVAPMKSVVVSYHQNTPDKVVSQAKDAIIAAGGKITHEFTLIKAFSAKAPQKILESVQAWGSKYDAVVEDDGKVFISGNN